MRTKATVYIVVVVLLNLFRLTTGQFIHIFEVQDENRAPKSDLFDPAQYKYVSPAQLQKQQEQNKLLQPKPSPTPASAGSKPRQPPTAAAVPELRSLTSPVSLANDVRVNEIATGPAAVRGRNENAYTLMGGNTPLPTTPLPPATPPPTTTQSVTFMQPISRILANITANEIPEQFEMELRKQIRMQQSENRYSRTQPLRVSAQNQRQYVVRVPPPFAQSANQTAFTLPQQQLPPNLRPFQPGQFQPQPPPTQFPPQHQSVRLSTLNSVLAGATGRNGSDFNVPSDLLNSFLQRTQQTQFNSLAQPPQQPPMTIAQPPYATNIGTQFVTPPPPKPSMTPLTLATPGSVVAPSAPTGRSVNGVAPNAISLLQPPVTNKESLTDEDIRLIEEHNRKVRLFLQQRQAELNSEQERQAKAQAHAQAAAVEQERYSRMRAEQEAAARAAAEQERARRIKVEQEAAARAAAEAERIRRMRAEQEAAARAAQAEQERIQRIKAEQEAAARAAAEQERIRRLRAEQEAAARAAAEAERVRRIRAEQERIQRMKAEQEAAARAAADQERIRRLRAEQEAAARAAAEGERLRRLKAEQEAAQRAAAEQERLQKLREQEMALRAAAEQERIRRIREEQEQLQKLKAEHESAAQAAAEQERLRQLRAQQEAAIRFAEAERDRLQRLRAEQELTQLGLRYRNPGNSSATGLSYQPEPSLALDDPMGGQRHPNQSHYGATGLDAARLRAEKEALAEQERLLRFQASQQALAHQQAAEQARLRRLREEEMLKAEEERAAREAQERRIMQARNEQNRLIHAARNAAAAARSATPTAEYTPYTEELSRYQTAAPTPASNYTDNVPEFRSLNNVRTPEPRNNYESTYRTSDLPSSQSVRSISSEYRNSLEPVNQYQNRSIDTSRLGPSPTLPPTSESGNSSRFKPAKISLQELPPDLDADGIPGVAGRDYPTLTQIPKTSFSCARQPLNGYYADTETACQVVHMCQMGGVQDSFLCPNGTIWNQEKFACQWWYEVSCATAPSFYALNNNLYKGDGKADLEPGLPSRQA